MEQNILNCLILGSGPAGLTAAIYASRAGLNPVVYEGIQPGGQLTTTTEIENFPGYPQGTTGVQMMDDLRQQALRFGADIRWGIATEVDFSEKPYKVTIDGTTTLLAHTIIIATGASAKYLGLEDEAKYAGSGVSACSLSTRTVWTLPRSAFSSSFLVFLKSFLINKKRPKNTDAIIATKNQTLICGYLWKSPVTNKINPTNPTNSVNWRLKKLGVPQMQHPVFYALTEKGKNFVID